MLLDATRALHARALADRYELATELGRGTDSVVYLAREIATEQLVALKLLAGPWRFARSSRAVAALTHPHIVRVLKIEMHDDAPAAVASELINGESLRARLDRERTLSVADTTRLLRDVASALAYAQSRHVAHGRVRAENVILEEYDGPALLGDFPVVERASLDTPSINDVYALGLLGWEMLAGRSALETRADGRPSLHTLRPDAPKHLAHAIERAIAPLPQHRWREASEFLAQLELRPTLVPVPVPNARRRAPRVSRRTWAALIAIALLPIGATAIATLRRTPETPPVTVPISPPTVTATAPPPRVEASGIVTRHTADPCESFASSDQRLCVPRMLARHDASLQRAYDAVVVELKRHDDAARAVRMLAGEQREWRSQRDSACSSAVPEREGKRWAAARVDCLALRAAERAGQLRARIVP